MYKQNKPCEGTLYIVATPIGNIKDITLRALDVLKNVDLLLCEDTRITMKLLSFYSIKAPKLIHYNDLCTDRELESLLSKMLGANSALVSNAGCPCFSDPGHRLVSAAKKQRLKICPIPGANAFTSAIMASGMNGKFGFKFCGFVPKKKVAKKNFFESLKTCKTILSFFDRADKLIETLDQLRETFNDPEIFIAREMTKMFETFYKGNASRIISFLENHGENQKGEITLLIDNTEEQKVSILEYSEYINYLSDKKFGSKEIAEKINLISKISKKEIYDLVNEIKNKKI